MDEIIRRKCGALHDAFGRTSSNNGFRQNIAPHMEKKWAVIKAHILPLPDIYVYLATRPLCVDNVFFIVLISAVSRKIDFRSFGIDEINSY